MTATRQMCSDGSIDSRTTTTLRFQIRHTISWIAFPCDEEYVNPSWMLMPVGNLVGAVAARPVSDDYAEWGWFLFGIGVLLWLALWPINFRSVGIRLRIQGPYTPMLQFYLFAVHGVSTS